MRLSRLGLAVVLIVVAPVSAPAQTPVETARGLLKQYQDDPGRIDRARDLLEAAVAKGAENDVPTLLTLARAWFLYGEERGKTDEARVAAYERARAEAGIIILDRRGRVGYAHNAASMQIARYDAATGIRHLWLQPIAAPRRQ